MLSQILIWKLAPQNLRSSFLRSYEGDTSDVNDSETIHLGDNQYMTVHLGRIKEHEGSIFRIAWSSDGSKFMSVSDDRRLVCFAFGSHCLHQEPFYFRRLPFMILLAHLILFLWQCSPVDAEFQVTKFCQSASQSRQC